jgi:hypothetical protein
MRDIYKSLGLSVWDSWGDVFRKAKQKGETEGYATFLANEWVDYRERNMGELLARPTLT